MRIYYQTNNHDCGIAITQTLIHHFFKREVSKEELYREANIKEDGLSILDLEILNEKYGIQLESYSMTLEEFMKYRTKDYFLLVINRNGEQHYTLGLKRSSRKVVLFDPAMGKVYVTMEELRCIWTGIFITVAKKQKTLPRNIQKEAKSNPVLRDKVDAFQVWIMFCINAFTLLFSIFNTYLIKYSFNHVREHHDFRSLFKVVLISIVFFGLFYFGELLESWLSFRNRMNYSKELHRKLMDSLNSKKTSYFRKLGKNQFLLLKDHIDCIASYHSEYVNKWLLSVFILFISGVFLGHKNPKFLLLFALFAFIQWVFWKLSKEQHHKFFPVLNEIQNTGKRLLFSLDTFLNKEHNPKKLSYLSNSCVGNLEEETVNQKQLFWNQNFYAKLNSFLNNLIYLGVFGLVAYSIFFENMNFGHLMIMNIFYFHISKSFNSLLGYYQFKSRYDYSKQIYSQLLNVDTFSVSTKKESISLPQKIDIRNLFYSISGKVIFQDLNMTILPHTLIVGPSGSGKSMLFKLIIKKINPSSPSIYFDERDISTIHPEVFQDLCVYQVSDSYVHHLEDIPPLIKGLSPEMRGKLMEICQMMNLDLSQDYLDFQVDSLSSGQKQLINIILLLNSENKVLLLDEIASNINAEARIAIYEHLISYIALKSFVVCIEHSPEISHLFSHSINICDL